MKTFNKKLRILRNAFFAFMIVPLFMACADDEGVVGPQPGAPRFTSSDSFGANENKENGQLVGTVKAVTDDFPEETITYTITLGNEDEIFSLDKESGDLKVNKTEFLNYEEVQELTLNITASNSQFSTDQLLTVNILDLEDERYLEYTHADNPSNPGTTSRSGVRASYGDGEWQVMDIWEPISDTETQRPIILLAGGGIFGDPSHKEALWGMANDLSQRGFVAAYVYFTRINEGCGLLGCDGSLEPTLTDVAAANILNVQDLRGAIRFLRKNSTTYKIDPDQVYVGGWSTGGSVMLTSAMAGDNYIANSGDAVLDDIVNDIIADSPNGLDGDLNPGFSSEINGVMAMMVSAFDLSMIDASDPHILLMNHKDATTAPSCNVGEGELRTGNWKSSFFDGHEFMNYGTDAIFESASTAEINNGLKKVIRHNLEQNEDMDYDYLIQQGDDGSGAGFCPNVGILTSANYNFIANFFYRLTNEND